MHKKECIIIGDPVVNSLSPVMHNAAYKALQIDKIYNYSAWETKAEELEQAVKKIRNKDIVGVSVTAPHKVTIMSLIDEIDQTASEIGAVNTLFKNGNSLKGSNTDWLGVLEPLKRITNLKGKKALVLGAGGAARAACYALKHGEARLSIANRSARNADNLCKQYKADFISLSDLKDLESFEIIINSIPYENSNNFLPLNPQFFHANHIFFDMLYLPLDTNLITAAKKANATTISGIEMLLHQGVRQFEIFTGLNAPIDVMRSAILDTFK